ncbi:protein of unknown function [Paraburkholderia dioscoreae]|uniref:Uncharacterized protein n=1 Tax=Paraburkholderia dioscoreae TaxID=2604047 RepID=A0A5Q4ZEB0_9BURK|nr:protein of unknown function [Paraburkholderia dioscoreae]
MHNATEWFKRPQAEDLLLLAVDMLDSPCGDGRPHSAVA